MICVYALNTVDLGQSKDNVIDICSFSARRAVLRSNNKYLLTRYQNNMVRHVCLRTVVSVS